MRGPGLVVESVESGCDHTWKPPQAFSGCRMGGVFDFGGGMYCTIQYHPPRRRHHPASNLYQDKTICAAVVGLSVNLNVLDVAEKRVKSRFSFRQVRLSVGGTRKCLSLDRGGGMRGMGHGTLEWTGRRQGPGRKREGGGQSEECTLRGVGVREDI